MPIKSWSNQAPKKGNWTSKNTVKELFSFNENAVSFYILIKTKKTQTLKGPLDCMMNHLLILQQVLAAEGMLPQHFCDISCESP